jgi:hypothetical protein
VSAQFEVITISLSFVLGLSMAHMLWSAASAVRARNELILHWLPFIWAIGILLHHLQFWFAALTTDRQIDQWTWSWYLHLFFMALLLFASGALVLPSESQQRAGDLLADFRQHGRLALVPLAAYQFLWIPTNYRGGSELLAVGNLANVLLGALILVGFTAASRPVQYGAALLYTAGVTWATLFVWAPIL